MEQRHKEYIEYYQSRLKKYEKNPLYINSYQSEKALYDAIANAANIEEFGNTVESLNLAVKNAIAWLKIRKLHGKNTMKKYKRISGFTLLKGFWIFLILWKLI